MFFGHVEDVAVDLHRLSMAAIASANGHHHHSSGKGSDFEVPSHHGHLFQIKENTVASSSVPVIIAPPKVVLGRL